MTLLEALNIRAKSQCELCSHPQDLEIYTISPQAQQSLENSIIVCSVCLGQILNPKTLESEHWKSLSNSMWSEHAPVQVMAYRMLNSFIKETWATELLEQLYLEEDLVKWALHEVPTPTFDDHHVTKTVDSNGTELHEGDSVTLIKDLDVKGAGFTAKRGTLVREIRLTDNPEHIEGRVNGTLIVLVTQFLKKANP